MTVIKSPAEVDRASDDITENAITEVIPPEAPKQTLIEKIAGVMDTYNRLFKSNVKDIVVTEDNEGEITAIIRACKTTIKQINDARLKITKPMNDAIKEAIAQAKAATDPIESDLRILNSKMTAYHLEKERAARAEAERIRQEELAALEQMKKDALKKAEEEEAKKRESDPGDLEFQESKSDAALEEAARLEEEQKNLEAKKLDVKETIVRTDVGSSSTRKVWKGDIKDEETFIKWCIKENKVEFLKANPVAWNQFARMTKKTLTVPGASVYLDTQLTTRKKG